MGNFGAATNSGGATASAAAIAWAKGI